MLSSALIFAIACSSASARAAPRKWLDSFSGAASPAAVVTHGSARFTVLTPSVIRVEVHAAGEWDDAPSVAFVHRKLPVPKFDVKRTGDEIVITTASVELRCASARSVARSRAGVVLPQLLNVQHAPCTRARPLTRPFPSFLH
jgi:hypothetical protein